MGERKQLVRVRKRDNEETVFEWNPHNPKGFWRFTKKERWYFLKRDQLSFNDSTQASLITAFMQALAAGLTVCCKAIYYRKKKTLEVIL